MFYLKRIACIVSTIQTFPPTKKDQNHHLVETRLLV
jgi:hypothetical protein